ncbi:hypothetical protein L917_08922 [Phytophthora nicotianae]|nr:hypothetical protein L917_08922 [Phytophthora nicotianae]
MSLSFILCESEEDSPPRTRLQRKERSVSSSVARQDEDEDVPAAEPKNQSSIARRRNRGDSNSSKRRKAIPTSDRLHHVRQLQNMRQRRYRERKKSTASALQANADNLLQENGALETAILEHFNSQK